MKSIPQPFPESQQLSQGSNETQQTSKVAVVTITTVKMVPKEAAQKRSVHSPTHQRRAGVPRAWSTLWWEKHGCPVPTTANPPVAQDRALSGPPGRWVPPPRVASLAGPHAAQPLCPCLAGSVCPACPLALPRL